MVISSPDLSLNCTVAIVIEPSGVQFREYELFDRLIYSTSKVDPENDKPFKCNYSELNDAYCPITQALLLQLYKLQVHDECNCTIMAQIRAADDQSDSRILI